MVVCGSRGKYGFVKLVGFYFKADNIVCYWDFYEWTFKINLLKIYAVPVGLFLWNVIIGFKNTRMFQILDVFFIVMMKRIEIVRMDVYKFFEFFI